MKKATYILLTILFCFVSQTRIEAQQVGTIPGQVSASPGGGATYSFPIECPSGIMGMQPNLSLSYNSQRGDGAFGVGWDLSGLSIINKSIKNIFDDNAICGIENNTSYAYVLNGQRLFVKDFVQLNSTYSATNYSYESTQAIVGSTYQAENKDYSKIETIGIAGYFDDANPNNPWTLSNQGPRTFKVTSKDGYIREYTANPDEYDHWHDYPLTWYLKKITDTNGNYISYNYLTSESQTILKSIAYTGSTTTAPFDSIVFNYNTKVASYTYVGSTKIANKFLLDNIQIKYNSTLLKQYSFTYISRKNKYYINDVTLTGQNNLKLNSTAFEWGNDNTVIAVNKLSVPTLPQTVNAVDRHWLSADVNGDGLSDAINIYPVTTVVGGVSQTKNYLQVFKAAITSGQVSFVADANYDVGNNFSYADLKALNPSVRFADLYGKNKEEIIIPQLSTSGGNTISFNILGVATLQQTLQASNVIPAYAVGDINNDGKEEIIYIEKGKGNNGYYPGKIGYNINGQTAWEDIQLPVNAIPKAIYISDFNADGLKDLMILTDAGYYVYKNGGGSKQTDGITHVSFPSDGCCAGSLFNATYSTLKSGDFNGDGLMDFIFVGQGGGSWNMAVGNSAMQFNLTSTVISSSKSNEISNYFDSQKDCIVTDFNHDGKPDVILIDPIYNYSTTQVIFDGDMPTHYLYAGTTSTWYSFNGSNFVIDKKSTIASPQSSYPYTTSLLNPYYTTLGDFDGDGREDVLTYGADMYNGVDKSNQLYLHDSYNTNFQANLLKSVTNGMGKTTQIAYQPLTYATTANNKPFYTKGSSSVYPVCDLQMPLYCVSNISEPNGQGGLLSTDFSYAEARTQLTGVGFLGFKSQTTSNAAANKKSVTTTDLNSAYYLPDKITQDVSTLSNDAISKTEAYISNTQTGSIFESLKSKVVGTDYLTGLSNTTEYSGYDGYGNPTTVKTTQGNVVSTQTVAYVQKGSWCPNKQGSITMSKVKDGENYTRHVDYSYDDKGNLTGQTADAGDVNQKSVVYSQFNTFGQPTKAQITANGSTRAVSVTATPSGRFILSQTNVLGQTVTYSWDETRGLLNSQTDRLGTTTYTYNGLGQLLTTQYPTGIIKASTPQWATAGNAYNAKFYISTTVSGATPQNNWYDVLGREVLKETTGLNGKVARTFTEYNANGQLYRVSDPTFNSVADVWATTYAGYDAYGRPQTITSPMGTTTMAYSGTSTTVTSPNGTKQTVLNSAGQVQTNTVNGKTVTYNYFPSGLAKTATPDGGQAISMEYDLQGRRTKLTDPDAGIVESAYNGFGELLTEKQKVRNATDYIVTTNNYDGSTGLLQTVLRGAETTAYTYDTNKRVSIIEIAGKNKQTFTYGDFDRVTKLTELINGTRSFDKQMEYDSYGRVSKEIFPSSYYTTNTYDTYGNLTEVKDVASRSIWKAVDANARGQLTKDSKGGKETTYGFDARGFNTSVQAVGVVDMAYVFDTKGNMYSRTDNRINQTEQFTYDPLNRLTNWDVHQTSTNSLLKANSIIYDSNTGNIANKSDLGNFTMNYAEAKADGTNAGPHALTTIMGVPTSFPAADLNVTYTDFKKMASLTEGTKNYTITYGVDQQRRKSEYSNNGTTSTRYYLGDYEEESDNLGNVKKIHYLSGGAMLINLNGVETLYYGYTDNQGALIALTDQNGNLVERYAYDPWGARRNPDDWTQKDSRTAWITSRGYTGHEHLDAFGIINMNGRVYDPLTAQFFSPDPFVQAPGNWVNYNRYGYCMNNPLTYTDPSGYLFSAADLKSLRDDAWGGSSGGSGGGGFGGGGFSGMSGGGGGYSGGGFSSTEQFWAVADNLYNTEYGGYSNGNNTTFFKEDKLQAMASTFGWDHLYIKNINNSAVIVGSIGGEITGIKDGIIQATNNASVGQLNLNLYLLAESGDWKQEDGSGNYSGNGLINHATNPAVDFFVGATEYKVGQILSNRGVYGKLLPETVIRTALANINVSTKFLQTTGTVLKGTGFAFGVLGMVGTVAQYQTGQISGAEASLDLVMGGVGFIPGWGWAASGAYFLIAKPLYNYATEE